MLTDHHSTFSLKLYLAWITYYFQQLWAITGIRNLQDETCFYFINKGIFKKYTLCQ